jgi:sulfonate transport system substrate-binding protein
MGSSLAFSTTLASCGSGSNTASNSSPKQTDASSASPATSISDKVTAKEVRIVRSKALSALAVLEKQGNLEKALAPLGVTVKWLEFAAGPQQLEAINANGLDIAATAESPPIFAQAASSSLVYLATTQTNGKPVALLVAKDSPIKSVAALKGKKVAIQKASIGHYLLVRALEQAGLKLTDVESVFLPPPDANVAFTQGKVDGWFIWDPFITRSEEKGIGRVLVDGEKLRDTRNFYSTSRKFYQENPQTIRVFLEELQKAELWTKNHPQETAQLLAPVTQLEPKVLEKMHKKYEYGLYPITEAVIKKQEEVAAFWYELKLIPKKPNVREGFLTPEEYAAITPKEVLALK